MQYHFIPRDKFHATMRRRMAGALACALLLPGICLAAGQAYDSGGTNAAETLVRDARRATYHGRYTEAIADDTRALTLSPNFARGYMDRADKYMGAGRYAEARADIDRVAAMHPDAIATAMALVTLALRHADGATAMAEIARADKMPIRSFWHEPVEAGHDEPSGGFQSVATSHTASLLYADRSIAEQLLHQDDAALADMQKMLQDDPPYPWYTLARFCYSAAVAGLLEMAELTCQQTIDQRSHDIGQYDSLGNVHLRMKAWAKAIADYNKALESRPDLTLSLYGRGVAKRALGDQAGGNADIAAATRDEPDIANIMHRLGVQGP
jgi:tetratricopeptide (TPR) repeat protein